MLCDPKDLGEGRGQGDGIVMRAALTKPLLTIILLTRNLVTQELNNDSFSGSDLGIGAIGPETGTQACGGAVFRCGTPIATLEHQHLFSQLSSAGWACGP